MLPTKRIHSAACTPDAPKTGKSDGNRTTDRSPKKKRARREHVKQYPADLGLSEDAAMHEGMCGPADMAAEKFENEGAPMVIGYGVFTNARRTSDGAPLCIPVLSGGLMGLYLLKLQEVLR
ncbi:hypothetical protein ABBQ38_014878 [Trebouxia sp. C0009 RCD-2024]